MACYLTSPRFKHFNSCQSQILASASVINSAITNQDEQLHVRNFTDVTKTFNDVIRCRCNLNLCEVGQKCLDDGVIDA